MEANRGASRDEEIGESAVHAHGADAAAGEAASSSVNYSVVATAPGELQPTKERTCIICLEQPVQIMLLNCHHAVLCQECYTQLRDRNNPCPICRAQIQGSIVGNFQDDFVRLVVAAEANIQWVQASAYDGMYNHIRPLLVVGALTAAGAVVCFVVAPVPLMGAGVGLAGAAFLIGYVPWFATTVAAFENQDLAGQGPQLHVISQEDRSRPFICIVKAVAIAVAAPVSVVVFFGPYALYKCLVAPLSRCALGGLIRGSVGSYVYIMRPLGRCTAAVCRLVGRGLNALCHLLGDAIVTTCRGTQWLLARLWDGVCAVSAAIRDHILEPSWRCLCAFADATWRAVTAVYTHVVVPSAKAIGGCATSTGNFAYECVLAPVGRGAYAGATALGRAIAYTAEVFYEYILAPTGRATWRCLVWMGEALAKGAELLYEYVLVPLGQCTWAVLKAVGQGTAWVVKMFCRHVVYNVFWALGQACYWTYRGLALLARGLAIAAQALFEYVLMPIGKAIAVVFHAAGTCLCTVLQAIGYGIAACAQAVFVYVLRPVGQGIWWVLCGIGSGVAAAATALYIYVLTPCGHAAAATLTAIAGCVRAVALGVAAGVAAVASATYHNVMVPVGQAIVHVCSELAAGARAAFTAVRAVCAEVAQALRSVAAAFGGRAR